MEHIEADIQNFMGKQSRQSQNSIQLLHCLTNSTTEATHLKIVAESDKYIDSETPVGKILFKLMMQKAVINKRATATYPKQGHTTRGHVPLFKPVSLDVN